MSATAWIVTAATIVVGLVVVFRLLLAAAGRRPDGSIETILQADAENRTVFERKEHGAWDGEVRITRPTDPRIIKQVRRLNAQKPKD